MKTILFSAVLLCCLLLSWALAVNVSMAVGGFAFFLWPFVLGLALVRFNP